MTFKDVFKNKFLNQFAMTSPMECVMALVFAILLGLVIYFVYKKTFNGVAYSRSFNLSLLLMTLLTTVIIITITANPVLSLGMVGALSIIRFRTVIKDPVDIMYLFWAISTGIIIGAKQYTFAMICVVIVSIVCLLMNKLHDKDELYLVIVRGSAEAAEAIDRLASERDCKIRNRSMSKSGIETIIEVRSEVLRSKSRKHTAAKAEGTDGEQTPQQSFLNQINAIEGVETAVLVNYNGEYCE